MVLNNSDAVVHSIVGWTEKVALQHSAVRGRAPVVAWKHVILDTYLI